MRLLFLLLFSLTACHQPVPVIDNHVDADGTPAVATDPALTPIAGDYYSGDGMGWNLDLHLQPDGRFHCDWHGCVVGSQLSVTGDWSLDPSGKLLFQVREPADEAFLTNYFDAKAGRVAEVDGNLLLILADQEDFFREYGPSTASCFSQDSARDDVKMF